MGLPWVRLDANVGQHDKILALTNDPSAKKWQALSSYFVSLAWSGGQGTDGRIPDYALAAVHGTTTTARLLVKHGLWDEGIACWQIRNYANRQELEVVTAGKREMKRMAAEKGNCSRWHGPDCWTTGRGCRRAEAG